MIRQQGFGDSPWVDWSFWGIHQMYMVDSSTIMCFQVFKIGGMLVNPLSLSGIHLSGQ
jgi:hypothetical protein